jgi:hypothetical protein
MAVPGDAHAKMSDAASCGKRECDNAEIAWGNRWNRVVFRVAEISEATTKRKELL